MTGLVLVHGGSFGASCWDLMTPHLESPVRALDLPGRGTRAAEDLDTVGTDDFASAVVDEIERSGWERVVLAGHSLAGVTLPRVAARMPERIAHLVFIACTVPAHGESCADTLHPDVRASTGTGSGDAAERTELMSPETAAALLGGGLDAQQRAWMLDHRTPEARRPVVEPCDLAGLSAPIPRTWIRPLHDAIVTVDKQDRFVENIGGAEIIDLDAGHMAMISHPMELAKALDAIVVASAR